MVPIEEQISTLSEAELEVFPLGIARLDRAGNVLFFNQAEERFANRRAQDTIGLNYFREVAPCTAVKAFQGRFIELFATREARVETFSFRYPFWLGAKQVTIKFIRRPEDDDSMYVVTQVDTASNPANP